MASKVAIEVEIKNIKKVADLKESLKTLRKETKAYEKEVAEGTKQTEKSAKGYINSSKAIKKQSKDLRDLKKELNSSTKSTKAATKSNNGMAKQFVKGAAAIGLAVTAFRAVSKAVADSIKTFTSFEFQMAKVRAVAGASNAEFIKLTNTAQELGRTTFFTATQVGELQTNFAKLGFTTTEILAAQEATLQLATATGSDLARSAIVAGSAVRGFGLNATETQRVVDVMSVAFTSSALDIEKFQTSMTKVAPIASAAGISIESTSAIMGTLTDAGIEASIAGTSLRNIFLKMQNPASDLSKHLGFTVRSSDDLEKALKQLNSEGLSNADMMQLVDLRQVAAFQTMVRGVDNVLSLTTALENSDGAGREMADMVGDTLEGAFKRLTSATEGLQIAIVEGFIGQALTKILNVGANVLNFFTDFTKGIESVNDEIATSATIYKAQAVQLGVMADRFDVLSSSTNLTKEEDEELQRILIELQGEFGRSVISVDKKTDALILNRQALDDVIAKTALLADTEALKLVHKLQNVQKEIKSEQEKQDALDDSSEAFMNNTAAMADNMASQSAQNDATTTLIQTSDALGNVTNEQNINENELNETYAESVALGIVITQLQQDELLLKEQLTDAGWSQEEIQKLLNQTVQKNTEILSGNTDTIVENLKAKQQGLDVEREMVQLLMNQGVTSKEEEARITEYLNGLREKEIELQLKSLNEFVMDIDLRKKLLLELDALQADTNKDDQKRKEDSFEADIARAIMSGQSAEEAVRTVVKAQIMRAVSGLIVSIFESTPFPLNLVLAAGATKMVGRITDTQLGKFGNGGVVETFANGGMVNGKSHAQGGEKFAVGGRVVELEGGEAVINKRSTAMFRNQLSSMNSAGGGVKFADGGLMSSPSFTEAQFGANNQSAMMGAMGGQRKVVVVEADITDSQSTVSVIQANATF